MEDILDAYEAYDTVCPCPSYEGLRRDWFETADASIPWDEIETPRAAWAEAQTILESCFNLFFEMATSSRWKALTPEERVGHIEELMKRPQIPQRTTEWYAQSKEVLTASEFSVILGTPRAVGTLALQKAAPVPVEERAAPRLAVGTAEMGPMDWGVRFEPVVKQVLNAMWGAEIVELGRLIHPTDAHLAASPDGAIVKAAKEERAGRLVEIKCPIRREIKGVIPFEYWCQMQIQMEVCDIDECEYVEVKLNSAYKGTPFSEELPAGSLRELYGGTLWLMQQFDTLETKYAYTALEKKDLEYAGWNVVEEIPWNVDALFTQVVPRDRAWYESTAGAREAFWACVEKAKIGDFVLAPSARSFNAKAASSEPVACAIVDD